MDNQYTKMLDNSYGDLCSDSDTFEADLLKIIEQFKQFSERMDTFLQENGYTGDITDANLKVDFIKEQYRKEGIKPPREIKLWFDNNQPITRETAYQLCFAFKLDLEKTSTFFRKVMCRERCFDCHESYEAVYYWCIRNKMTWQTAQDILLKIPEKVRMGKLVEDDILYTGTILHELDQITTIDDLVLYINENQSRLIYNNASATKAIQRLWMGITKEGGLLERELQYYTRIKTKRSTWDCYLAMMGIEKNIANELPKGKDRTLVDVIKRLPKAIADSFPGRESIEKILRSEHVDYEIIRKWLILLSFYEYWCHRFLSKGNYCSEPNDFERCRAHIDQQLAEAGYMTLYPGNPYDWLFLYSSDEGEPLRSFRNIWQSLTDNYLAEASEKPD